jgi:hypothetical protein
MRQHADRVSVNRTRVILMPVDNVMMVGVVIPHPGSSISTAAESVMIADGSLREIRRTL